jgi:hypothetical protein
MVADAHEPYVVWNRRVALFWLTKSTAGSEVFLTITPGGLSVAAWESDGARLSPDEAEADFVGALRGMYRARILDGGAEIARLADEVAGDAPASLAFLALSVLAAYRMHADTAHRSTAYFPRLSQLLDCRCVRGDPEGLSKPAFEQLWMRTSEWMRARLGRGLFLPQTQEVVRRYEVYPISHAGLRQVDLERLPQFFTWADYAPGSVVSFERLRADLRRWVADGEHLTGRGRSACADERLDVVVQQIAQELKAWDGIAEDPATGRRVAHVELTLDLPRGIPKLAYLARRPPGFPEVFEHGSHRFDSLEEGWYDPLPVQVDDGRELLDGFEWESTQRSPSLVLRRARSRAIALVRSEEFSGFASRRRLLEGVDCAVLYHDSVAQEVEARISALASKRAVSVKDVGLPTGWRLLVDIRVDRPSDASSPGLEALEVDGAVELLTVGGLRIGRRAEWLAECPPTVLVSGRGQVSINGKAARLRADGSVEWEPRANTSGTHVFEAGRAQRRITLVAPDVAPDLPVLGARAAVDSYTVALARGRWTLLGSRSGEVQRTDRLPRERILRLPFEPIWAIGDPTPDFAVFLCSDPREPEVKIGDGDAEAWAAALVTAADHGKPLASLSEPASRAAERSWVKFVRAAKQIQSARVLGSNGKKESR